MFSSSQISNAVENTIRRNNSNVADAEQAKVTLTSIAIAVLLMLLLNIIVGPFLWNNVLRRLIPTLKVARWYETVALAILFGLIIPH